VKRRRALLAGGALALVSLLSVAALQAVARPSAPRHVVARGPFKNEVLAYGQLQAVKSTPITVPADLQRPMRIAWLAGAGPVKKGDAVVVFDPTEVEKQFADSRSDRDSAQFKLRKASLEGRHSGDSLQVDGGVAKEELKRAEDVAVIDTQIFSRNQILESQTDRTLLAKRVDTNEAKRDPTARLAAADMALAEIERKKAELRMVQAEKSLSALKVTAPHDGILVFPLTWQGNQVAVGDTVWPSQPLAEIPDLALLEARVYVLEGDAFGLAKDLKAKVEIEGQPGLVFDAKVVRVDAVAKTRERGSPVKYFETTLALEGQGTELAMLKPGQKVRSFVLIDDMKDVIAVPRGALFEKDGKRIVYKLEGGGFQAREVTVGRRGLGRAVVDKGLQPGDELALHDPEKKSASASANAAPGAPPVAAPSSR
jgi:RND family efflux transporter MFP subunit